MKRKIGQEAENAGESSSDSGGISRDSENSGSSSVAATVGIVTSPTFSSLFSVTPSLSSSSRASVTSIREEKKACRRHRRRLARIVTEQWKYAARSRLLAVKFNRVMAVHRVRNAFLVWKDLIKEKAAIREKVKKIFPNAVSRRFLRIWVKFTNRSNILRLTFLQFSKTSSDRRSRSILNEWRGYAEYRLLHEKQMLTASHYYTVSLLSRCFSDWRLAPQVKQKKEFYKKVAYAKWTFTRQRTSIRAWKCFIADKHFNATLVKDCQDRTLSKCLHSWRHLLDSERESEIVQNIEEDILSLVLNSYFNTKKQRTFFSKLSIIAATHRETKYIIQDFYQHTILMNILKKSFRLWREYQTRKYLQHNQECAASSLWRNHRLRSCFIWFKQYVSCKASHRRRGELAMKHWKANKLRICMFYWMEYASCKKSWFEKQGLAYTHWRYASLRRCLRRLSEFNLESRRTTDMEETVIATRTRRLISKAFHSWKVFLCKRKLFKQRFMDCKAVFESHKLAYAWRAWREFRVKRLKSEQAEAYYKTHTLQSVLCAWHAEARHMSNHLTDEFYSKLLQKLAFLGWYKVQKSKLSNRDSQSTPERNRNDPKHVVRMRPAPRRPALSDVHIRSSVLHSPAFDASSVSNQSYGPCLFRHEDGDKSNVRITNTMHELDNYLNQDYSQVIADEVAWMEHLLSNFDDLRAELVEKRAELALLLEKNIPGSREHGAKIQILTQKIALLQQRRAILLPTIQAVASVVPGLRLRARKTVVSSTESNRK